jgi:membrane-bound lytic murein transglycosylase A
MEGLAIPHGQVGPMMAARLRATIGRAIRHGLAGVGAVALLCSLAVEPGHGREGPRRAAPAPPPIAVDVTTEPLKLPNSQVEPIEWSALDGWAAEDHATAFTTFRASCRPLVRAGTPKGETRPMYFALKDVCRRALAGGLLTGDNARLFFEQNFRPARVAKLGDSAGLLTGYYEPIVEGSRFPTPVFKVAVYRRPPDLIPPPSPKGSLKGSGFPNRGQSLRLTSGGRVPYYDRGEILKGALDGKYLEICWIKDQSELLTMQLQGSARVRLEDGVIVRLNYDGHNGYPFVPVSRILADRKLIPREEMSAQRMRDWMRENPEAAEEVRRGNRNFVFFRIVGLSEERDGPGREAVGAQGIPLTPERSIAVDDALHVYGTPFFVQAGLPINGNRTTDNFTRLMIAQDTGSAIVGPARADIYWGAGDQAGQVAGRTKHPGSFAMMVPMEIDPVAAGRNMPLPPERPPADVIAGKKPDKPPIVARGGETKPPPKPPIVARGEETAKPLPKPPIVARGEETAKPPAKPPIVARGEEAAKPLPKPPIAARGGEARRTAVEKDRRGRSRKRSATTGAIW